MANTREIAQQFLQALAANSDSALEAVLADDAGLRLMGPDGLEAFRPRERVAARLRSEWLDRPDARLECLSTLVEGERAAVEFRIQATDPASGRYLEQIRAAYLTVTGGRVGMIDLYCPAPVPSAHRKDWIAPATLSDEAIDRVLEEQPYSFDVREPLPPKMDGRISLRRFQESSGGAHPGSNQFGGTRWTEQEADAEIEAVIEAHRQRGLGFVWYVFPHDTPADLGQRLERHGLMLAGTAAVMVRAGLDELDTIPVNPDARVVRIDFANAEQVEAALRIGAAGFNWPPEQIPEWREHLTEQDRNPHLHETEIPYLAYLDGQPAGIARLSLRAGLAYLSGAATLPELRSRKVYSTLLRHRLQVAHSRGYHLASVQAEPMSRRVLSRYGFKEYARTQLYAWMPVMDPAVIRSLVPDD